MIGQFYSRLGSNKKEKGGESKYKFFKSKGKTDPEEESLKAKSESLIKIKQMIATSGDHLLSEADVTVIARDAGDALLTGKQSTLYYHLSAGLVMG